MTEWLFWIDLDTILSNLIGGAVAILVALYISRREFNRRREQRKRDWYRAVHNQLRMGSGFPKEMVSNVTPRGEKPVKVRFGAVSEALKMKMTESPPGLHPHTRVFLKKTTWYLDRFSIEVEDPLDDSSEDHKRAVVVYNNDVNRNSLIALYLIEQDIDIKFQRPLTENETVEARGEYNKWRGRRGELDESVG